MNEKEKMIYEVMDLVIEECTVTETAPITREDITGKCKRENVCMSRCIFVTMLYFMGYSTSTVAGVLHRTEQAISDILNSAHQYKIKSWAYRIAEAQCTLRVKDRMSE